MMVLLQATQAEVTQVEIARSKYSFAENIGLVIETRLEQKNSSRFMTITCYSEADFTVKKLEEPVLKIKQVPGAKILEVRKTLSETMLVLAEYTRGNSPKVEFNVSFPLYGAQFMINQKGFVHPQTNKHRLQRAQRGLINVNKAQLALDAAITAEQKQEAQKQLLRSQRDLDISNRELNGPIQDFEILYDHEEVLHFFQWTLNAIDRVPELTKLLDESVINKFKNIPGATTRPPVRPRQP